MELCVRMHVNSASPASYLANGAGSAGPSNNRVRASVAWFGRSPVTTNRSLRRIHARFGSSTENDSQRKNIVYNSSRTATWTTGALANCDGGSGAGGDDNGAGNGGGGNGGDGSDGSSGSFPSENQNAFALVLAFCGIASTSEGTREWGRVAAAALAGLALFLLQQQSAFALSGAKERSEVSRNGIWEVKGGRWKYLVPHPEKDEYVVATVKNSEEEALAYEEELAAKQKGEGEAAVTQQHHVQQGVESVGTRFMELGKQLLLPDGYPSSVTDDYIEYTLWRMGQVIASQISGVLTTQVSFLLSAIRPHCLILP